MNPATGTQINWAKLAHELRGPLAPLRTVAWLLRNEPGASSQIEAAEIMDRQTRHLARLIDELGEWGSVYGKRGHFRVMPIDVTYLFDVAIANIPDCQVQPAYTDEAMAFPLEGDVHQLGKMLHAILAHAIHRDTAKQPLVSICVTSGKLDIRACDNGPVLDASASAGLFTQPLVNAFDDGLGLRLLIAREIAEAHGGNLSVDSTDDRTCVRCVLAPRPG